MCQFLLHESVIIMKIKKEKLAESIYKYMLSTDKKYNHFLEFCNKKEDTLELTDNSEII